MSKRPISISVERELRAPEGTSENPYAQLEWIFEIRRNRVPSESGRSNYDHALAYYITYLRDTGSTLPFEIRRDWDALAMVRFKAWLTSTSSVQLSSHTKVGIMSALRQVMVEGMLLDLTKENMVNASAGTAYRETEAHEAYDDNELAAILEAIQEESKYVLSVLRPYDVTGAGRDPKDMPFGFNYRTNKAAGIGWSVFDNLRWYFENRMECRAVAIFHPDAKAHKAFFVAAARYFGGALSVYRSLGVADCLSKELLGPLLIQLMYLTGLNPSSAIELEIDCLYEHPLAGVPVLRYIKKRSNGELGLFLDLLNEVTSDEDEEAELPLRREQAVLVERTIERILQLTAPLRTRAETPAILKKKLFIYESSARHTPGKVMHFELPKVNKWCDRIRDRYNLRATGGGKLSFSLVRFRPTKLTEMAAKGKDFFEIQQVAGHKSIKQTLAYIQQRTLDAVAEREVTKALETIWANHDEFVQKQNSPNTHFVSRSPYKGLIADCKNVFAPPKNVLLAADYVEGQACTRFNMCILCKNVVVMKEHLPVLAHYRAQLRTSLSNTTTDLPHVVVYEKTLSVLDQIFDITTSEFSEEDLAQAEAAADSLDIVVDGLIYAGVQE